MAASALPTIVSTLFTSTAGGAAFQGLGTALLGGAISGIGMAKMQESKMREEERQQIAEEDRVKETYEGAGDAMRFWDNPEQNKNNLAQGQKYVRADAKSNQNLAVGKREAPRKAGQQYRTPQQTQTPRYRYDRNAGQIVRQ